jgi:hypothetical protein
VSSQAKNSTTIEYATSPPDQSLKNKLGRVACRWSLLALVIALLSPATVIGLDLVIQSHLTGWFYEHWVMPISLATAVAGVILGIISAVTGNPWGASLGLANIVAIILVPAFQSA